VRPGRCGTGEKRKSERSRRQRCDKDGQKRSATSRSTRKEEGDKEREAMVSGGERSLALLVSLVSKGGHKEDRRRRGGERSACFCLSGGDILLQADGRKKRMRVVRKARTGELSLDGKNTQELSMRSSLEHCKGCHDSPYFEKEACGKEEEGSRKAYKKLRLISRKRERRKHRD